jgi:hypothetical protein
MYAKNNEKERADASGEYRGKIKVNGSILCRCIVHVVLC